MSIKSAKSGQKTVRKFARFRRRAGRTAENLADDAKEHLEENLISRIDKLRDIRLLVLEWSLMVLAIIVLALLQSFWFEDSYSTDSFSTGGSYIEGTLGSVTSLNPLFASTNSEKTLSRLLFATLAADDYSGHVGPGLAESITTTDNGKTWRARLRADLQWSDGEPLTVDDVIFTVGLIQSPKVSTTYSSNLSGVKAARDGDSVVFTLPSAYADFSGALTFPVLPQHILGGTDPALLLEDNFSFNPVSSGPFRYNATQTTSGESVVYLSSNPYYYGGQTLLSSFAVHTFNTEDAIISALTSGAITATAEIDPASADKVKSSAVYEKQTTISSGVYLFMNTTSSVFKSKTTRQALQKGLDIAEIRQKVLGDEPALSYPILSSQISLSSWPALPALDQASAAATLAAYADEPIVLATIDTGYFPALARELEAQLKSLGLAVTTELYTPGQDFLTSVVSARNYDLLLYEIELGAEPDVFAYYHSSQTGELGLNLSDYNDAITDDLIIAARTSTDAATRQSKYEAFLARWVENAPAIGIYQVNISYFLNRNVRAFSTDNTLITALDRFTDVASWSAVKTTRFMTP